MRENTPSSSVESAENELIDAMDELSEYLPERPDTPVAPQRIEFRPWHKPRKQFIRLRQWWSAIDQLLGSTTFPADNRVFRYLTLPSEDMLDIRVLREKLSSLGIDLKYLGYCDVESGSNQDTRMNLAESDVKGSGFIHESSIIVREKLEDTANHNSLAHSELDRHGPFHAINIDLCAHFAQPRNLNANACVDAVNSIVQHQVRRNQPKWLFFLTTRVRPGHIDSHHLQAFIEAIRENINSNPEFASRIGPVFNAEGDALLTKLRASHQMSHSEFKDFFCIGFGKWLLTFLASSVPQLRVEMLPSYYYSVYASDPDMLSLGYCCTAMVSQPADRFGLVAQGPHQERAVVDEAELGVRILEETAALVNLDEYLLSEPAQMEEMIVESERFLAMASYDITEYRRYLERAR